MHAAMKPKGGAGVRDVVVRQVEQGARLLAAPPNGVRVILQMPRGNLEGICPRVLVLAGIAAHLQVEDEEVFMCTCMCMCLLLAYYKRLCSCAQPYKPYKSASDCVRWLSSLQLCAIVL